MVLVNDTLSYCALQFCMKFHLNSFNGCQLTERTRNSIANDQGEMPPKLSKTELWFLCMTHRLIVLYHCMKFHFYSFNGCQLTERTRNIIANDHREITPKISYSFNGCQLTERTRNSIANDHREITPKISKAELWFLCMTHRLIVLYNCVKFHLNNLSSCQLTERTRNSIANDQREITPKISKAELWFLCMTRRLNVLYKCMKFR